MAVRHDATAPVESPPAVAGDAQVAEDRPRRRNRSIPPPPPSSPASTLGIEDAGEPKLAQPGEAPPAPGAAAPGAPPAAEPTRVRWTPDEARLAVQGAVDAAGLPLYKGKIDQYEQRWRVKDREVDDWSPAAARLLDRTPAAPGAAGLLGIIPDVLVVLGGFLGVAMPRLQLAGEQLRDGRGQAAQQKRTTAAKPDAKPEPRAAAQPSTESASDASRSAPPDSSTPSTGDGPYKIPPEMLTVLPGGDDRRTAAL